MAEIITLVLMSMALTSVGGTSSRLARSLIFRSQRVLMMMLFEMEVGISAVPSLRWLWAGSTGALALREACA